MIEILAEVTIPGKYIAQERFAMVRRAVDIILSEHPNIDWCSSELVLTVVPKTEDEQERGS